MKQLQVTKSRNFRSSNHTTSGH